MKGVPRKTRIIDYPIAVRLYACAGSYIDFSKRAADSIQEYREVIYHKPPGNFSLAMGELQWLGEKDRKDCKDSKDKALTPTLSQGERVEEGFAGLVAANAIAAF